MFAFGVLALEVLSGRPNSDESYAHETIYLLDWVHVLMLLTKTKSENIHMKNQNFLFTNSKAL